MQAGLEKILPDRRDYSLLHTFGAVAPDPKGLPDKFSIYDGRTIPNQDKPDTRFTPTVRALPYGCTGESQTFLGGLEDAALYRPDDLYDHTPPYNDGQGRDMRKSLQTTIDRGYSPDLIYLPDNKRTAYFNCYGKGVIDDFDAARIAIWLFQAEKRAVTVGSWWYPEFAVPTQFGSVTTPSFDMRQATLHNWIITGWRGDELECLSWQGEDYGYKGKVYISRAIYNKLMQQPYTGAFTVTKNTSKTPVPIGMQAVIDHLVYFIFQLLGFNQKKTP